MNKSVTAAVLAASFVAAASAATAQETGIQVRSVRVLATDAEALAAFYEKAFGMSETRRPLDGATKEIVLNSGSTPDIARRATTVPIIIYTRPRNAPAGALASLILEVPNLDQAIAAVEANGGALMRPRAVSGEGIHYAFLRDPDGNQIELVEAAR
jgi:predicted enzyme related to lactoylglutathione lyase